MKDQLPLAVEPLYERHKNKPFLCGRKEEFERLFRIMWQDWVKREPEIEASVQEILDKMKRKEDGKSHF